MLRLSYPVMAPDVHVDMMAWKDSWETVFPKLKRYAFLATQGRWPETLPMVGYAPAGLG